MQFVGGVFSYEPSDDGELCDWWLYEDKQDPADPPVAPPPASTATRSRSSASPTRRCARAAGTPRPASRTWTSTRTEAQMCFPSFPRFCGQTFMEAPDMELADLCVKAYNDWMVEEWCGGSERPPHPAHHRPAVGRRARRRRDLPQRRPRRARRLLQRDPALPRPAVDPHATTGSRSSGRAPRPAPSSTCTSARRRRCRRPPPTRPPPWARRSRSATP